MLSFHGYASSIRFNPTRGIMNINCFIAAINTAINRCQDVRCRFDTDFIIHVKGGSLFFFVRLRTSRLLREKRYSIWHEVGSSLTQPVCHGSRLSVNDKTRKLIINKLTTIINWYVYIEPGIDNMVQYR